MAIDETRLQCQIRRRLDFGERAHRCANRPQCSGGGHLKGSRHSDPVPSRHGVRQRDHSNQPGIQRKPRNARIGLPHTIAGGQDFENCPAMTAGANKWSGWHPVFLSRCDPGHIWLHFPAIPGSERNKVGRGHGNRDRIFRRCVDGRAAATGLVIYWKYSGPPSTELRWSNETEVPIQTSKDQEAAPQAWEKPTVRVYSAPYAPPGARHAQGSLG
jgi:hypothetical protein